MSLELLAVHHENDLQSFREERVRKDEERRRSKRLSEGLGLTGEHAQVSLSVKGGRGAAPLKWVVGSSLPSLSRGGSRSCIIEKADDHQI